MTFWIPGPWHREGLHVMAGETIVATVTGALNNVQAVADAQLCASAPTLYDALEKLVDYIEGEHLVEPDILAPAKAALRQAETL